MVAHHRLLVIAFTVNEMAEFAESMDWIHLHLALNHVPVMGTAFVGLLLLTGMIRKSEEIRRLSLWWLLALTVVAIPIKFTGDFAAEKLSEQIELEKGLISAHEEAADQATTGIFFAGIAAAVALFKARNGNPVPQLGLVAALIFTLLTLGLMARTANLGGQVRHPEIRGR